MIRRRRAEDLAPLCALLDTMRYPVAPLTRRGWLEEHDDEQSWVFDMAPVTVAPTKNVVGHVQIHAPDEDLLALVGPLHDGDGLLVIGKLFVRPDTYEHGLARFLVRESTRYIRDRGMHPVLEHRAHGQLSMQFCEKLGFQTVASPGSGSALMTYTR